MRYDPKYNPLSYDWSESYPVLAIFSFAALLLCVNAAYGQTVDHIIIPDTTPCFLSDATLDKLWKSCQFYDIRTGEGDWLQALATPWTWITGGYLLPILMAITIYGTWLKYRSIQYPLITGSMFLPITFSLFPENFIVTAVTLAFAGIAIMMWRTFVHNSKDG